jgi:hypothetical protein
MGYQLIETIEVGSGGAASIEFTGIDQTGQDLVILVSTRHSGGDSAGRIQFNGDTTDSNYTSRWLQGNGSGVLSVTYSAPYFGYTNNSTMTANTFNSASCHIPNYTSSSAKSFAVESVQEDNNSVAIAMINAGIWNVSSAITSLKLYWTTSLVQYSTASLYKITAD